MADEENIQAELLAKFPFLQDKIRIQRARRVFAEVPAEKFKEVFDHLAGPMGFNVLCTITGLDLGQQLGVIYHLSRNNGLTVNVQIAVPKDNPVIQTVSATFPPADAYERELCDLLGFQVQGLPPGHRYPLPDGWPDGQYPLRKEWKTEMLSPSSGPSEVKNG